LTVEGLDEETKDSATRRALKVVAEYIGNADVEIKLRERTLADERATRFELVAAKDISVDGGVDLLDNPPELLRAVDQNLDVERVASLAHDAAA
jgi:hypothetical protein